MKALELLKAAHDKKVISRKFKIPAGEKEVDVVLTAGDRFMMAEAQEVTYQRKYAEFSKKGLDKSPVNRAQWDREISGFSKEVQERLRKDPPANLADQLAQRFSKIETVTEIIPRFLKLPDGTPLCGTQEEIDMLRGMIHEDPDLMTLLAGEYVALFTDVEKVEQEVKN